MIKLVNLCFLFILFSCNHPDNGKFNRYKKTVDLENLDLSSQFETHKIIAIKDGDTYIALIGGEEQVIRLEHIDCPEKKQPFGARAKQFAIELCHGKFVYLNHSNKYDRNKRLLAEVILINGINVNKELVKNGLAWHFKKYSNNTEYSDIEILAQKKKIGIWSDKNPIAPWDWRKK